MNAFKPLIITLTINHIPEEGPTPIKEVQEGGGGRVRGPNPGSQGRPRQPPPPPDLGRRRHHHQLQEEETSSATTSSSPSSSSPCSSSRGGASSASSARLLLLARGAQPHAQGSVRPGHGHGVLRAGRLQAGATLQPPEQARSPEGAAMAARLHTHSQIG